MSASAGNADYFRSFADLTYDSFRQRAKSGELSPNEKIGFPKQYRDGYTDILYADICSKLPALEQTGAVVFDIGCGCGDLVQQIIAMSVTKGHSLYLFDSAEMLDQIQCGDGIRKVAGFFPDESRKLIQEAAGTVDVVLIYSVIQYVFGHSCLFGFLDVCLSLLKPGGRCLIGDIPNQSMRNRFFSSLAGIRTHQEFTQSTELPEVNYYNAAVGGIDDSVVLSLATRARNAGFHAFLMPQDDRLPAATRREDLLIVRP